MSRFTRFSTIFAALVTTLAVIPGIALADPPERFHDHTSTTFTFENFCGISGDGTFVYTQNTLLFADGTSRTTFTSTATYTNPLNGRSVKLAGAGPQVSQSTLDEEAGTVTFVNSTAGLYQRIQTNNGPLLLRDAGLITRKATFDLQTGELISSDTIINGPHPQQDPEFDFDDFCEIFAGALS